MTRLHCWLFGHDWLRAYSPGHIRLRCVECGHESPGLRGPLAHVEPPIVTARRKPKSTAHIVPLKKRHTA